MKQDQADVAMLSTPLPAAERIEAALQRAVDALKPPTCPPRLAAALRHAVFPAGGRLRPQLLLAVAGACGDDLPRLSDGAAAAIELLHCASLVHDDLPCFDAAAERRGRPSVHCAFGEGLAVLAGDGLIVAAFDVLAQAAASAAAAAARLPVVLRMVAGGVGPSGGIVAGQAWEAEPTVDLERYHDAKTGALFEAAVLAGAAAAGAEPGAWAGVGVRLGGAYQIADDIADVLADPKRLGKPVGRDRQLDRPSAVRRLGIEAATKLLNTRMEEALERIPACGGREALRAQIAQIAARPLRSLRAGSLAIREGGSARQRG